MVMKRDVIACFDMDKTTIQKATRDFLKKAQERNEIVHVDKTDIPKSFILTKRKDKTVVYLSNLTVQTIAKRNAGTYPEHGRKNGRSI